MITCIIPARMSSSRFPGKPLRKILGRELVLRVCDIAKESELIDNIVVATEDWEIHNCVLEAGYNSMMTPKYNSCTHRVAKAAQHVKADYYVNLQGDEPCVTAEMLDDIIKFAVEGKHKMVQAVFDMEFDDIENVDVVKAVVNNGNVINLTRVPEVMCDNLKGMSGIYVYDRPTITNFFDYDLGLVEAWKGLDTFGFIGKVPVVPFTLPYRTHGVDRPTDIPVVEAKLS
jgi:3-deoxy-manno-octulosonate cytidylyltransferase (CMP-KDO synthetase)